MNTLFLIALLFFMLFQGCYTEVQLPKTSISKSNFRSENNNKQIEFYKTIVDTFDNNWLPDSGYYYTFNFNQHKIKKDKIDQFLNMLYANGYNIISAWYRPSVADCNEGLFYDRNIYHKKLEPVFILLLSDFDDSIIEYNFYALMDRPVILCPYNVEEYISE